MGRSGPIDGFFIAVAALIPIVSLTQAGTAADLSCPMQKAREVSFRNATAKDVLEVSIGPCERATLTIVIRSDLGHILYSYVAPFKQHVADWYVPELDKEARRFVDGLIAQGVESSASLPPWEEPDAYEQKHAGTVEVSREVYEERSHDRCFRIRPIMKGGNRLCTTRGLARRWWL